jgi:hypothetical protein
VGTWLVEPDEEREEAGAVGGRGMDKREGRRKIKGEK